MASLIFPDSGSEFEYDFSPEEEHLLLQLASQPPASLLPRHLGSARLESEISATIDSVPDRTATVAGESLGPFLQNGVYGFSSEGAPLAQGVLPTVSPLIPIPHDVSYPNLSRALSNLDAESAKPPQVSDNADTETTDDDRSPLQRFRSFPKRPLTVSDLTSGAWCELQYCFTLTRLPGGRRTRTPAMRQGTKVHQKLEDEVHTTVRIDIMSKEDGFGLKIWNLVQGLRTLRDTGLTRELEVWGMVDGNVVNGVIDSASYQNPDPEFEEELSSQESQSGSRQRPVTDYFPPARTDGPKDSSPKVYLTDVKTRGSAAPVSQAMMRPAKIQLLLYHRFLSDMAAGQLDFLKVFRRYGLDPDAPFSDTFIAQIGELHDEIFVDTPTNSGESGAGLSSGQALVNVEEASQATSSAGPDLLRYRSLRELVQLVTEELQLTFPWREESLGHMLRVQYLHRADGRQLDLHVFPVSRQALDPYLARYMAWWRGERDATGVEIEEAFKCRSCEFASDCSWRQGMDEDRVRQAQHKILAARRRSATKA